LVLVDLPVMLSIQENKISFPTVYNWFFETREQLVCAFVLIDIRHDAQTIDIEFMSHMERVKFFCIIFTKDKISKVKLILILQHTRKVCLLTIGLKCLNISWPCNRIFRKRGCSKLYRRSKSRNFKGGGQFKNKLHRNYIKKHPKT
jgi:GTP-binding protein EngB required for normal cell division